MAGLLSIVCACASVMVLVSSLEQVALPNKNRKTSFILSEEHEMDVADSAFRICDSYDMVAVTIQSEEKYLEVVKYMNSHQIGSVWTAGDDLLRRNVYEWTVDTAGNRVPFMYFNWVYAAPLADESCRCVSFVSGVHNSCGNQTSCAGMTVEPCHLKRRVICEYVSTQCQK